MSILSESVYGKELRQHIPAMVVISGISQASRGSFPMRLLCRGLIVCLICRPSTYTQQRRAAGRRRRAQVDGSSSGPPLPVQIEDHTRLKWCHGERSQLSSEVALYPRYHIQLCRLILIPLLSTWHTQWLDSLAPRWLSPHLLWIALWITLRLIA